MSYLGLARCRVSSEVWRRTLSFKYAILGLLAEGPLHGYELKALYDEELVPSAKLNFGQVYPTLDRLQRDGWVDHDVVSQQERPDKKVYALTGGGRGQLKVWLETPTALNLDMRNETFLKLMLARRLKNVEPLEVLKVERRACFARLHDVTQARARAKAEKEPLQTILLLDLAVLRLEAFMKWLENCDEVLRQEGR
jgi:DNA-binding PadR family transcriptional regulator